MRFVPVANFNGAPSSLTIRALDNTYGSSFSTTAGSEARVTVNTTTTGTTTAISAATATVATSINADNDASILDLNTTDTNSPPNNNPDVQFRWL